MNQSHDRFQEWLAAGADGEPPRDLAVHASVCAICQRAIAAFDRLAAIDPGRAHMPVSAVAAASAKQAPAPVPARAAGSAMVPPRPSVLAKLGSATVIPAAIAAVPVAAAAVTPPRVMPATPSKPSKPSKPTRREREIITRKGLTRVGRLAGAAAGVMFSAVVLGIGASQLINLTRNNGVGGLASPTPSQSEVFTNTPQPSESFTPPETTSPMESVTAAPTPVATAIPTPIPTPIPTAPPKPGSPGAPTGLTAVATIGYITLHWSAPASNGGSPITRYDIYRDGSNTKLYSTTTPTLTEGVGNGDTHVYRVTAVNKVGAGPYSNPASATTPNVPGAPGTVTATGGNGQVAVTWTAPASNGGSAITEYDVYKDGGSTPICAGTSQPCTNSGLGDGESHIYTVKARNAVGLGAGTSDVGATWNVPGAPTNVAATGGNGNIGISWSAPGSNGGTAVTGYDVYREDMGTTPVCSTSALSCPDSPLGDGVTHTYTVKASNVVGQGSGASDSATTWDVPGAASSLSASDAEVGQITVTWTAAASHCSCTVTYDIYRSDVGLLTSTTLTTYVDSAVTASVPYDYYVIAHNVIVGFGPPSNTDTGTAS